MSWTDERVTVLRKLWSEGKTAAEIAKELGGVTRNAVIGKAHRLKLSNRVSPINQNNKKPVKAEEKAPRRVAPAPVKAPVDIKIKGVKMNDLREKMCRWPLGDPRDADFIFCGCQSVPGLPYCPGHAKVAYQAARNNRILQPDDLERQGHHPRDEDQDDAREAARA